MPKKKTFTTVELFAGAGGLAIGLENAGLRHNLLVEIDKYKEFVSALLEKKELNVEQKEFLQKEKIMLGYLYSSAFSMAFSSRLAIS